jgi:hypothetical protein
VAAVPGPDEWKPLWDVVDDQDPVEVPRAYVIPVGEGQRSMSDAENVVRQLLLHEIEVGVLRKDARVGGTTYPRGSYVVDMHQPLRGLANSLLDLGTDISAKVPEMYDISAWSYSYLWGATVDKVGSTTDAPLGATKPVTAPVGDADVPGGKGLLTFELAGVADYQALNALLEQGVAVSLLADGTAVAGSGPRGGAVGEVARTFDLDLDRATAAERDALDDPSTRGLEDLTIAVSGTQDDILSLTELGFDDLVPVSSAALTADPTLLDDTDVLWVASGLGFSPAQAAGRAAVQSYVDSGRSIVGAGAAGFNAASGFGLVSATRVAGNPAGNGIVAVDTPAASVLAPHAQDHSFIYPAGAFTGLGAGTTAQQTYEADPFLAGHWLPGNNGVGPQGVAGQASAIAGESASGSRGFVFGTSVFFRNHVKGGQSQAAQALFWAGPEGDGVTP